jgi:serine/threonine-protein kinase
LGKKLNTRSALGKYRLRRRLARGGFAQVFEAFDTIEGIRVALKIPEPNLVKKDTLNWFRQEARTQATLDHPNILPLKNAEMIDGHFVLVYAMGERSLAERMRRRIDLDAFLDLAEQMLSGVASAHESNVIHCDLKPENFILFKDGRLRLTDFGIAKIAHRTIDGSGSGTLGYIAPEQAMGKASFRSDVFSLGLILYQMLARELPEWPFSWPPQGYGRLKRKLPDDFFAWLRCSLQLDPRYRYPDAQQMLSAFRKLRPRVRRHLRKERRRSANGAADELSWKQIRFRQFERTYRSVLALDRRCGRCGGPALEAMSSCPWCGKGLSVRSNNSVRFPGRCNRCQRGRKLDWRFCAWCFGPGFARIADRSFSDRRYEGRCGSEACRGPLLPFARYCPWCRRKTDRAWKIPGCSDRCERCGWGVARAFWEHCPWCTSSLQRQTTRRGR